MNATIGRGVKYLAGATLILLIVGVALLLFLFPPGNCQITSSLERLSPDGELLASAEIRDCGPTTPFRSKVTLGRNSLRQFPMFNNTVFSGYGSDELEIEWKSPRALEIRTGVPDKKIEKTGKYSGVEIHVIKTAPEEMLK